MKTSILIMLFLLTSQNSFSQVDQNAVLEAQKVLRSPQERQVMISKDPKAQEADQFASQIVGRDPALKNELYDISAEILNHVMSASDGDPAKAQELMLQAMKNPQQFLSSLPASEQEKIRKIGYNIDQKKNIKP